MSAARRSPRAAIRSQPDPGPAPTTRAYDCYVELKRRILDLRMAPGTEFTEGELVTDFGLSKTPIREALARLRQEGLVDAVARSGYRVTPVTLKDARDLLALRIILDGEAAALAAVQGADPRQLHDLDTLCRSSYDPRDRPSIVAFLAANHQFHLGVAKLCGNDRLIGILTQVLEQLQRVMHLGLALSSRSDEIVHEHTALVTAIVSGDSDAARDAAVAQARATQVMVLNALLSSDVVMSANLGGSG